MLVKVDVDTGGPPPYDPPVGTIRVRLRHFPPQVPRVGHTRAIALPCVPHVSPVTANLNVRCGCATFPQRRTVAREQCGVVLAHINRVHIYL